ncbi:hypothetical protein K432DRAFT_430314 [Lepidopterella palustris CBS 459.81]|uniref:Uncharacterized protein n=1 Tax=Lepidopterella palustris CBS 459.81 TaxID=1314670 RepID=A0A8E2DY91_9PEZI|nr:hypothetical protein K432DRAFT_430314 [Lepidopterella palustris CBS 459.81]
MASLNTSTTSSCNEPVCFEKEFWKHRFFIWHPDTSWYPAFARLVKENQLPASFCAFDDDLDRLCLYMRSMREGLIKKENAKNILFHILIPAWAPVQITAPLHFPEDLYPLQNRGAERTGEAAPDGSLHDVSNVLDPNHDNIKSTVAAISTLSGIHGSSWYASCLLATACVPVGGLLLTLPVYAATAGSGMLAAFVAADKAGTSLAVLPPRILGSTHRL